MASVVVRGRDIELCNIQDGGSWPMIGDKIDVGTPAEYRGRWIVVDREHRVFGDRCVLAIVYVTPLDAAAHAIHDACERP